MTPRTKAAQPASRLRIVSLGGVDEIGKNMTVFEYEDDIVVVDCGSIFPKEDMLGVDLVIPDVSYLVEKKRNVRGYLFTHGHEDHIGATPYILRQVPAPLYGTKLTLALVDLKLKEHRIQGIPMQVVQPRDEVRLGKNFTAKFIHVSHSIAGACAIALTCPAGTVVVTGDFKIDYTPVDGHITDLASFAELGERGVLAMLCESTNVERPGHTISEKKIGVTFENMFRDAQGRVIVAMFASNIHRMQMVIDNAMRYGRRVCFIGRSMVNVSRVAMQIGELRIPPEAIIEADALDQYPDNEILVMTICFCIVAAVVISLLTVGFADQIIEFCGSNEDTHAMAARYYRIIMGGMIFNVLSMGINAAQRGAGNTMIALRTNLISKLVNICGILHFRIYSGTGNDRYLDGYSGRSGIQIPVRVDSVPTGKMGDN